MRPLLVLTKGRDKQTSLHIRVRIHLMLHIAGLVSFVWLLIFCRSAWIHWCFGLWAHHILPTLHLLAAGQEAQDHQLALLGIMGLHHCWRHHHHFWGHWRNAWHHCCCQGLQILHLISQLMMQPDYIRHSPSASS